MIATTRKYIRLFAGVVVLVLGIVLALPFIPGPGIPLIILGLVLLSDQSTWAKRVLHWAKEKWHQGHMWPHGWPRRSSERTPSEHVIGPANVRD